MDIKNIETRMNTGIQLDESKSELTAEGLNVLLASYQVFYQNLRGFHWNIKGEHFFTLHDKFEALYTRVASEIDELAERVLMVGFVPLHSLEEFVSHSEIESVSNVFDSIESCSHVLSNCQDILTPLRETIKLAAESGDDGTADMLTGFLRNMEKDVWMLTSFLEAEDE
jgi:starvation-inducible DNA-binding protein